MPLYRANVFTAISVSRHLKLRHSWLASVKRSFSALTSAPYERVHVPCRSNGFITVDVFRAAKPSSPIIIYLPPGPVVSSNSDAEELVISILHETSAATIARINYRASSLHQYPTPYHDLLFGYDWVKENLLLDEFQRPYVARLGVCGELIGGSLATMLALTECRLGETCIGAAAVNNPLVDWVFPDELPSVDPSELPEPIAPDETAFPSGADPMVLNLPKPARKRQRRAPKKSALTAWQRYSDNETIPTITLSAQRDVLFRKPEDYFDRFASPIHFFRSPHAQLLYPQQDDILASRQPEELFDIETQMDLDHYASVNHIKPAPELPILSRCRAYTRNYPLAGTKMSLPTWNITTGMDSPLFDQAKEITKMLRRSTARHALKTHSGRTRWHDANEKKMYEDHAEEKVNINISSGSGLWTEETHNGWKESVQNMGSWMKQQLDLGKS